MPTGSRLVEALHAWNGVRRAKALPMPGHPHHGQFRRNPAADCSVQRMMTHLDAMGVAAARRRSSSKRCIPSAASNELRRRWKEPHAYAGVLRGGKGREQTATAAYAANIPAQSEK